MKTAIGLMSGTSMDGIDVALVRTDGVDVIEFGPSLAVEYSLPVRKAILRGLDDASRIGARNERPGALTRLEQLITELHADAVQQFLGENELSVDDVDFLGFHGQTVLHRPEQGLTVQLGDGKRLADSTGIDIVYDMRAADMIAGGQGAPLVPVFHQALAKGVDDEGSIAFVNIGGISNITFVGRGGELIAFDAGPGNALLDQWMDTKAGLPFDQGGRIASEGRIVGTVADRYLASAYFDQALPKSLDRADFSPLSPDEAELSDGARTLAYVTAQSIMRACDHLPEIPALWIICGGGRLNDVIMSDLRRLALEQGSKVVPAEEVDLSGDMLEAQAFAYLAVRSQMALPLTFPTTTGCKKPVTGGAFAKASSKT